MRVGLDIASVSYKRQADQIVLVAGDSDFRSRGEARTTGG